MRGVIEPAAQAELHAHATRGDQAIGAADGPLRAACGDGRPIRACIRLWRRPPVQFSRHLLARELLAGGEARGQAGLAVAAQALLQRPQRCLDLRARSGGVCATLHDRACPLNLAAGAQQLGRLSPASIGRGALHRRVSRHQRLAQMPLRQRLRGDVDAARAGRHLQAHLPVPHRQHSVGQHIREGRQALRRVHTHRCRPIARVDRHQPVRVLAPVEALGLLQRP